MESFRNDSKCFQLDETYTIGNVLGSGSYGAVLKCYDNVLRRNIAVKYIPNVDEDLEISNKTIRELFILHALRHENIMSLLDVRLHERCAFVFTELCQYDLQKMIHDDSLPVLLKRSKDFLFILWQILRAIQFIHYHNMIHRDIKPANILVNADLTVKLCDFGCSRALDSNHIGEADKTILTEYVVTRYYRAPEVFLSPSEYGKAQDVWSVACTFGEILALTPIFPGTNTVHQIQVIVDVLGVPTRDDIDFEMNPRCKKFLMSLRSLRKGLGSVLVNHSMIHCGLLDLMTNMLKMNPKQRITSTEALSSSVFDAFHSQSSLLSAACLVPATGYIKHISDSDSKTDRLNSVLSAVDEIQQNLKRRNEKLARNLKQRNQKASAMKEDISLLQDSYSYSSEEDELIEVSLGSQQRSTPLFTQMRDEQRQKQTLRSEYSLSPMKTSGAISHTVTGRSLIGHTSLKTPEGSPVERVEPGPPVRPTRLDRLLSRQRLLNGGQDHAPVPRNHFISRQMPVRPYVKSCSESVDNDDNHKVNFITIPTDISMLSCLMTATNAFVGFFVESDGKNSHSDVNVKCDTNCIPTIVDDIARMKGKMNVLTPTISKSSSTSSSSNQSSGSGRTDNESIGEDSTSARNIFTKVMDESNMFSRMLKAQYDHNNKKHDELLNSQPMRNSLVNFQNPLALTCME